MTRPVRTSILLFLFLLLLYSGLRLGFYWSNLDFFEAVPGADIAEGFLHGVRFDIAALFLVNIPFLVLYLLPWQPSRYRWYRVTLFTLFCAVNLAGVLLNVADFAYFPTVQRRLLFEPYAMLPDLLRMLPGTVAAYPLTTLLFVVLAAVFVAAALRLVRFAHRRGGERRGLIREFLFLALAVVLAVIGIRGGLQLKPLRQSNAFFSSVPALGWLALNSTYTVARSYFQPALPTYAFMAEDEARGIVRGLLFDDREESIDTAFVFLRKRAAQEPRRLNVVIIMMESWTASDIGSISGGPTRAPFFDSLATDGLLFTNFLANGQRSIEALPSILASLPGLYESSLIGSKAETNRFRGLGSILLEQGYTTSFHHGAATGSMGFDAFSRLSGFMRYFGREDHPAPADSLFDGVWGLNDEPFFLQARADISALKEPFCAALFSLSSHVPFEVPRHREAQVRGAEGETDFHRSMRYSDFALGQFFRAARAAPWFSRTVFLITGDHTMFGERNNLYAAFHVPLLIYAPGIVPAGRVERIASHVDVLPTVLDLLDLPAAHASMGRSALSPRERVAVLRYGPTLCLFNDSLVYTSDLQDTQGLYAYRRDPERHADLSQRLPEQRARMKRQLEAYLQCVTRAISDDRVFYTTR